MKRQGNRFTLRASVPLVILSGILTGISYLFTQCVLGWLCLIPLFCALERQSAKGSVQLAGLYGIVSGAVLYYWVIPVATRYSGGVTLYSILLFAGAVLYFSSFCALFGAGYHSLHTSARTGIVAALSIAGLFVILELVRRALLPGSPWLHLNLGLTQARQGWILQWTAIGGLPLVAFAIVFFSYLLTQSLFTRDLRLLTTAAGVVGASIAGGYVLQHTNLEPGNAYYRVVLLNDNIPAEMRWDDRTGDSLAHVFFRMSEEAVRSTPDLIVWTETAIPWTLEPDEQLIPAVLHITRRSRADHLIGTWMPSAENSRLVYNSACLITNDGRIAGRYDKTLLLDFLERPLSTGWLSVLPFFSTSRYDNILPGTSQDVISSGRGRIGVLICNESLSEEMCDRYARAGANLLVVMSNDAWFEHTPMRDLHFRIAGIQALMMGTDVIVNSNRGIVGLCHGNGDVEAYPPSTDARVVTCLAHLASGMTVYSRLNVIMLPLYACVACLSFVVRRSKDENSPGARRRVPSRLLVR